MKKDEFNIIVKIYKTVTRQKYRSPSIKDGFPCFWKTPPKKEKDVKGHPTKDSR